MQGGFVLRKMLKDPGVMGQQVMALRSYIKLLLQPVGLEHRTARDQPSVAQVALT